MLSFRFNLDSTLDRVILRVYFLETRKKAGY